MANHSPRTSTQASNVLVHPNAGNAPVAAPRRPGRLPGNVTSLAKARSRKVLAQAQAVAPVAESQSYSDRRDAAVKAVMQGPDAALFEEFKLIDRVLADLTIKVWELKNILLYRVDPELQQLGQVVGGGH